MEPLSSAWTGEGPSGMRPPGALAGPPHPGSQARVALLAQHFDALSFQVNEFQPLQQRVTPHKEGEGGRWEKPGGWADRWAG